MVAGPSPATEWTVRKTGLGFVLTVGEGRHLSLTGSAVTVSPNAVPYREDAREIEVENVAIVG